MCVFHNNYSVNRLFALSISIRKYNYNIKINKYFERKMLNFIEVESCILDIIYIGVEVIYRKIFSFFYVSRRGTVCFPFGNPTFLRRET